MNPGTMRLLSCLPALLTVMVLTGCHDAPPAAAADLVAGKSDTNAAGDSDYPGVAVDQEQLTRMGIETVAVAESNSVAAMHGTAIVLDSAALAAALADVDAARSDAASARENYERLQRLFADDGNASRQAVEAAQSQWSAARARLISAEARTRGDWGLPLSDARGARPTWIAELADGRASLLRAEFVGQLPAAAQLDYALLGTESSGVAALVAYVGPSRAAAVSAVGTGVLLRTRGNPAAESTLRPGERLAVIASVKSVARRPLVPAEAAFADGGQFWCYVQRGGDRFDRVPLAAIERVAAGYPVAAGIKAGDRVVVRGAPLLLSLERGAGTVAGDE